jgi:malonyl-CoA/methylmalonyl-CoA synthetase
MTQAIDTKDMTDSTLGQLVNDAFYQNTSRTALSFLRNGKIETELSYDQLCRRVNRMAHALIAKGVNRGDRVILCLEKSTNFVIAHLACQWIGSVSVPLSTGFKPTEMTYFLGDIQAALAVVGPAQKEMIRKLDPSIATIAMDTANDFSAGPITETASVKMVVPEVAPQDPALIIYTSGTTGKPKGAILTQGNLAHDAQNIIKIWEISGADVLCHALPLFHVHGLCFALHTAFIAGAHVLMLDQFSPEFVLQVLSRKESAYRCSIFMAVPAMYKRLLNHPQSHYKPADFDHIRLFTSGSAPLLKKDFAEIKRFFGKEPVEREGMSETGMNFSNPLNAERKPGSIGLPLPDLQVRCVDPESLEDVVQGEVGELWLKSPSIIPAYWQKPDETAQVFREGWFRTGDMGKVDQEGYFYLTDRLKDIIISGGENISPKEIERVLNSADGVAESVVVGVSSEKWGEKVVAAVVKKSGASPTIQALMNTCREHLQNWKCPKEIVFIDKMPRNTMGKIQKEKVKLLFAN